MKASGCILVLAAMLIFAFAMDAQADDLDGWYVGANFGRARTSYDTAGAIDSQIYAEAQSAGETATFGRRDIQKMSDVWWADAGYFFTPNVGIDAAFMHLGEIKYAAVGSLVGSASTQSLETTDEVTSHGPALSLVLRLPLTEAFAVDMRAGDYYGKTTLDSAVSVGSSLFFVATTKSTSSLLAGVGAAYSLNGHWALRLDYLHVHHTGDQAVGIYNVNLATAGVKFFF